MQFWQLLLLEGKLAKRNYNQAQNKNSLHRVHIRNHSDYIVLGFQQIYKTNLQKI